MAVEVDELEAGGQEALDLAAELRFELGGVDAAQEVAGGEGAEAGEEGAVRAEERAHLGPRGERALASHEGEVDPRVQLGPVAQPFDGAVQGAAVGDHAAGGDDPLLVSPQGSQGHAGVEADVVGRDDEGLQRPGLGASAGSGAAVPSTGAGRPRRRGWRISGKRVTSSRKIFRMTPGDDRVERPRVRGK